MVPRGEAMAMGEATGATGHEVGERRGFYVVWSPQGGDPVVRHESFGAARQAAWRLSEKHPGQDFFVLKSCWGRQARPAGPPGGGGGCPDGDEGGAPAPGPHP